MDVDVELLIHLVCQRPPLWDKTTEEYKNRNETATKWREVCKTLNGNFDKLSSLERKKYEKEIVLKWKSLRAGYRRALDRSKKAKTSGTPATRVRKYLYQAQMDFLRKIYDTRATEDTLGSDASEESSSRGGVEVEAEDQHQINENVGSSNQENSATRETAASRRRKIPKHSSIGQPDEFKRKLLQIIETPNRHISFMQGLVPTLETFTDDEVLQFQLGTLNLVQKIKTARIPAHTPLAHPHDTNHPLEWEQAITSPQYCERLPFKYPHRKVTSQQPFNFEQYTFPSQPPQTPYSLTFLCQTSTTASTPSPSHSSFSQDSNSS